MGFSRNCPCLFGPNTAPSFQNRPSPAFPFLPPDFAIILEMKQARWCQPRTVGQQIGKSPRSKNHFSWRNRFPARQAGRSEASIPACAGNPGVRWLRVLQGPPSIPACAGEPFPSIPPGPSTNFNPRVCGGTSWSLGASSTTPRFNPRVCGGTFKGLINITPDEPSIPACAGEPAPGSARPRRTPFNPRVCGGTVAYVRMYRLPSLQSPRVRGNLDRILDGRFSIASIPACAGEPQAKPRSTSNRGFNPRVCGGTSTLYQPHLAPDFNPRVCGGTSFKARTFFPALLQSPRVRGNRTSEHTLLVAEASIPACAGEP